jgi:uncharacterized protein (TIGR02265 family)
MKPGTERTASEGALPTLGEELERKRALATPADTTRGLFFLGALTMVREVAGEEARRRCLEVSGEKEFLALFSYPVAAYLDLLVEALPLLAPRYGGWEEALRAVGMRSALDFLESVTGRMLLMMGHGRPRLLLSYVPTAYASSVSYGTRSVVWEAPTRGRLTMRRDFMACAYHEGTLLALLGHLRLPGAWAEGQQVGTALDSEYVFGWE